VKILMISDVYFPRINGVSTSVASLKQELGRRGHCVSLVAPAYTGNGMQPEEGVYRVAGRRVPFDPEDRIMRLASLRAQRRRLVKEGFDLVHVHTPFLAHREGLRLASDLDVPLIETYHTYFEEYFHHYVPYLPRPLLGSAARVLARRQCNRVRRVVVPSVAMRQVLQRYGVRTPVVVIPTGVAFDEMSRGDGARFRRRYGVEPDRPVMLNVGRMAFEKNLTFLLRVFAAVRRELPEVLLVLAGEGPALGHIRSAAADLGVADAVRFVGYLPRDGRLQDCYAGADLFVFASRTETQGLVLLEAMALGLPVLSTAVMGTAEIVGPERGALRAEEDLDEFSRRAVELLGDRPRLGTLATEAKRFAREWSMESMADRMLDLYEEVLAEPGAPS
jgi:glycosyltransferase involved in cell wall biosynthesis